jgi:hypothetical protein
MIMVDMPELAVCRGRPTGGTAALSRKHVVEFAGRNAIPIAEASVASDLRVVRRIDARSASRVDVALSLDSVRSGMSAERLKRKVALATCAPLGH